jgi:hypothetical protein
MLFIIDDKIINPEHISRIDRNPGEDNGYHAQFSNGERITFSADMGRHEIINLINHWCMKAEAQRKQAM